MTHFISGARRSGRTRRLIEMSAETGAYIVCRDRREVDHVWGEVKALEVNAPMPITWTEFVHHQYGRFVSGFLIDNLDRCVASMSTVPIVAATLPAVERLDLPVAVGSDTNDLLLPAEIRSVSGRWVLTAHPWRAGHDSALSELRALIATVDALFLGGQR